MDPALLAFITATVGGALGGGLAGAVGVTALRWASRATRGAMLAFAGGFILAAAFLELIRRALENIEGWEVVAVLGGVIVGAVVRALAGHSIDVTRERGGEAAYRGGQARKIALSLAMINLVGGVVVGIGFVVGPRLGFLLAGILAFDNFMEGVSVSTELAQAEEPHAGRVFFLTMTPTLTLGIGAAVGALVGGLTPLPLAGLLGLGAGVMLYSVVDDIVYDAHHLGHGAVTSAPLLAGSVVGTAISGLG